MTEPGAPEMTAARRLFAQDCQFMLAAARPDQFPDEGDGLAEVAFVGRSNVGKSSLINALTGRKKLAKASRQPGRTQQIVFFNLADRLRIADLPGYGHAEAPGDVMRAWQGLMNAYLRKRASLRCLCLLIDSRHGLLAKDLQMLALLENAAVSTLAVLTKADQLKPAEREARRAAVAAALARHPVVRPEIILTSSDKGLGLDELRQILASFAQTEALPPS